MSTCKSNSTFLSFYFAPFSQIFNPPGTEAGQRKIRKGMVTFLLHLAAKKQCSETAGLFAAVPWIPRLRLVVLKSSFRPLQGRTPAKVRRVSLHCLWMSLMCENMSYIVIHCDHAIIMWSFCDMSYVRSQANRGLALGKQSGRFGPLTLLSWYIPAGGFILSTMWVQAWQHDDTLLRCLINTVLSILDVLGPHRCGFSWSFCCETHCLAVSRRFPFQWNSKESKAHEVPLCT